MRIPILERGKHLLVVNKPAGVYSQPDGIHDNVLLALLKKQEPELFYTRQVPFHAPKLVHRLDWPVSGAMILATSSLSAKMLSRSLKKGGMYGWPVQKKYVALLDGIVSPTIPQQGEIRTRVADKAAVSKYQLIDHGGRTAVLFELMTGRKHQLRVQAEQQFGIPILTIGTNQIALHSYNVEISKANQKLSVDAPITQGMKVWGPYLDRNGYLSPEVFQVSGKSNH